MKIVDKYPILGSSADSDKLALSVKGTLLLLIPVISSLGQVAGIDILESELVALVEASFAVVGSITLLVGLGRKLYYKLKV